MPVGAPASEGEEEVAHLTLNDRQDPGPTQPMLAHSSAKWSCFDLIDIDLVGCVPMDVGNDVAAPRSCCAVSPARPRVRMMTSSSVFTDGTVGSTGAAVVSELDPGKNTTSHPEVRAGSKIANNSIDKDLSVDPDHVQKGIHPFCHRPAEPETTADFTPTASAGPRQQDLKPTLLPTLSLGKHSARGKPLMARCTICAV